MMRVAIIGGGIIGITTALAFRLAGYDVSLFAAWRMDEAFTAPSLRSSHPELASIHAAASVLPHSVRGPKVTSCLIDSQAVFKVLLDCGVGVRRQRHFEVYETLVAPPLYADVLESFQDIAVLQDLRLIPCRSGVREVFGWTFSVFFAEAPVYIAALYRAYESQGGRVAVRRVDSAGLDDIAGRSDLIVNCTGFDSGGLFTPAREDRHVLRGHYLLVSTGQPALNAEGALFSYNYTPGPGLYPTASGASGDLYFYQRTDGWILGASRQAGDISGVTGLWKGEPTVGPTLHYNGIDVPAPIHDINRDLLLTLTGTDIDAFPLQATIGYRFENKEGLRIVREDGRWPCPVIHNTGHGGAGYTLSWGSALEAVRLAGGTAPAPEAKKIGEALAPAAIV